MNNFIFILFAFLSLPMAMAQSPSAEPADEVKLGLNWKAEPEFGGFYAAAIIHSYKKNRLSVKIQEGGAGTPTVQMISSGQVDFGTVSGDEIILAQNNGADVVALFAVYQKAPYAIMTHAEKGYKTLGDVFQDSVPFAVVRGLPFVVFLEKKYGFKKAKAVPYSGGVSTFLSDPNFVQQGFISSEPLLAEKKGAKTKTFLVADEGFDPYVTVLATRGELLKKKPDLIKRMVASVREGWRSFLDNPRPTLEVIAKLNSTMDVPTMIEMSRIEAKFIETPETKKSGLGTMTRERWKKLTDQLLELNLIKKPIDPEKLFVN